MSASVGHKPTVRQIWMPPNSDSVPVDRQDFTILLFFSISYLLGALSYWVLNSFPLTTGELTVYKILLGVAAFASIALVVGYGFLYLISIFVIDPIRKDLQAATASYDAEDLQGSSGGDSGEIRLSLSTDILRDLGYTDVSTDDDQVDTDQNDIDEDGNGDK